MVAVYYQGRIVAHEPPYTDEESMEIYAAASYAGGGATILHGSTPPGQTPPVASPQRAPEAPPQTAAKTPKGQNSAERPAIEVAAYRLPADLVKPKA
jgi:hypothetical protein